MPATQGESPPEGELRIVQVDREWDYAVTVLAPTFAQFVRSLRHEDEFETD
jgi:hypothetical protein